MNWMQYCWNKTWKAAGADRPADHQFQSLVKYYSEPHRKYHTIQHIMECLDIFEKVADLADHPEEVEIALWFHDVVYNTDRNTNEHDSASRAYLAALSHGLLPEQAQRIHNLVMATKHDSTPTTTDAKLIVDVDLAILGTNPERYDEYESQVREEYSWVPDDVFWTKRKEVLKAFADREFIYDTPQFRVSFEKQARENIARSLLHI
jgi:predicted metal-dependent HD superfamily phosphohydrolase